MREHGLERRRWPRIDVQVVAAATPDGSAPVDCLITDINGYGACIDFGEDPAPDLFYLIDVWSNLSYQSIVTWQRDRQVGVAFTECWDLAGDQAPRWLKQVRQNLLRAYGEQRALALTWSAEATAPAALA